MHDVIVAGAGLAGLSCARQLAERGLSVLLLEAADAPGGRVRTDIVDGFKLDRGFQVLLTAYPEAQRQLDLDALRLRSFQPGALVFHGGRFHRFADPFRAPLGALPLVFDPIVTMGDKLRVAALRRHVSNGTIESLFARQETTTLRALEEFGFSPKMVERFFRPFFGGVFLERELASSSRWFQFLFRMFSVGDSALPEQGMQAIPDQMAAALPAGVLRTKAPVAKYELLPHRQARTMSAAGVKATLMCGEVVHARALVVAMQQSAAQKLIARSTGSLPKQDKPGSRRWNRTTTFYYAAEKLPTEAQMLMLNGTGSREDSSAGPVNNACVVSNVAPGYAPPGAHLISASVVGGAPAEEVRRLQMEASVREHLGLWFGAPQVARWKLLGAYFIAEALPFQAHAMWQQNACAVQSPRNRSAKGTSGGLEQVFLCGDYCQSGSIQGALASGTEAANAVAEAFQQRSL